MDNPVTITVVGGFLAALAAALIIGITTYIAGSLTQKQANADKDSLNLTIESLKQKLAERSDDQIATLKELQNYQTGGDSYCYLEFFVIPGENIAQVFLKHAGKYPLTKVEMCILNANKVKMDNGSYGGYPINLPQIVQKVDVGDVDSRHRESPLLVFPFPNEDEVLYCIGYTSKGGEWQQRILFKKNYRSYGPPIYSYHSQVYKTIHDPGMDIEDIMNLPRGQKPPLPSDTILMLKQFKSPGSLSGRNPPEWHKHNLNFGCSLWGVFPK